MKRLPLLVTVTLAACTRSSLTDQLARASWVDLTYAFDSTTIYWPTAKPFRLEVVSAQRTPAGYYYAANNFAAAPPRGTHLPAPPHVAGGSPLFRGVESERPQTSHRRKPYAPFFFVKKKSTTR